MNFKNLPLLTFLILSSLLCNLGKALHKCCLAISEQYPELEKKSPVWGKNHWPSNLRMSMLPFPHIPILVIYVFISQLVASDFKLNVNHSKTTHLRASGKLFYQIVLPSCSSAISWFRKKLPKRELNHWPSYFQSKVFPLHHKAISFISESFFALLQKEDFDINFLQILINLSAWWLGGKVMPLRF